MPPKHFNIGSLAFFIVVDFCQNVYRSGHGDFFSPCDAGSGCLQSKRGIMLIHGG